MFVWAKRITKSIFTLVIALLFCLNLLFMFSTAVAGMVADAIEAVTGFETAHAKQKKSLAASREEIKRKDAKLASHKKVVQRASKRAITRATASAARLAVSAPSKALPYIGVGAVVTFTALELNDLCDLANDMKALEADFEISDAETDPTNVCGVTVPSIEDIKTIAAESPQKAWEAATSFATSLGNYDYAKAAGDAWASTKGWAAGVKDGVIEAGGTAANKAVGYYNSLFGNDDPEPAQE